MNTVKLYMADPIAPDNPDVPQPVAVKIVIDELLPDVPYQEGWRDQLDAHYDEQADALVDALYHALPQGTFDRVALKMFAKKLSLYRGVTNS